jgi:hypothetical protein
MIKMLRLHSPTNSRIRRLYDLDYIHDQCERRIFRASYLLDMQLHCASDLPPHFNRA